MKPYRIERLEKELLRIVNNALFCKASDLRMQQVTITDAKITPDMQFLRLYFSVLEDETDTDEWVAILTKASGFIKKEIADTKIMRRIPEISFIYDDTEDRVREVESILKQIEEEKNNTTEEDDN